MKSSHATLLFVAALMLLVACGGSRPPVLEPVPTPVPIPIPTEAERPTLTPKPTAILIPTLTPAPTLTPNPNLSVDGVGPLDKDNCPPDYPVKGNITSSGDHIYHIKGGKSYTRTDPERCFATEADARNAGFTKAAD